MTPGNLCTCIHRTLISYHSVFWASFLSQLTLSPLPSPPPPPFPQPHFSCYFKAVTKQASLCIIYNTCTTHLTPPPPPPMLCSCQQIGPNLPTVRCCAKRSKVSYTQYVPLIVKRVTHTHAHTHTHMHIHTQPIKQILGGSTSRDRFSEQTWKY